MTVAKKQELPKTVTIIEERPLTLRPTPTTTREVVAVTYETPELIRRTVYIDREKYDDKALREAIKADLEKLRPVKPRVLEL